MTLISPVEDKQLELENIRPTHLTCASCKKLLPIEQFYTNRTETSNYNNVYIYNIILFYLFFILLLN